MHFRIGEREYASMLAFVVFFALVMGTQILYGDSLYQTDVESEQGPVTRTTYTRLFLLFGTMVGLLLAGIVYLRKTSYITAEHIAKRMTADLSASRDQFQVLYENSPVPYLLLTDAGNIESPNKATLRFFGATAEECARYNLFDLLGEENKSPDLRAVLTSKVIHNVPINRMEVVVRTFRRANRWVLLSIFPLAQSQHTMKQHLVTLVDITENKELEQAKAEFLSLASHQLRTPLTAVKWYIDLLRGSKTIVISKEVRGYLDKIYAGNQRMIDIVATLLNLSRLETGTLQVEMRETNLPDIVRDVLDEVEPQRAAKQLTITSDISALVAIGSDPSLVRICFQNLVVNALRYTPQGGMVQVVGRCEAGGCTLQVTDSGVGIPLKDQSMIFTKMYRADNARKIEAKGTGLGLYMTRAFVKKLGGDIEFESIEGKGSTFTLRIPDGKKFSHTLADTASVYYHMIHGK